MSGLGEFLRSHRRASGVALEQIAEATRIPVRQLEALEAERFDELPGGVFRVSFVRQYARCVGAEEEQAVALLKSQTVTTPELPTSARGPQNRDPFLTIGPGARLAELVGSFLAERGGALASLTVGLLLIFGGLYAYQSWDSWQRSEAVAATEAETATPVARRATEEERQPEAEIRLTATPSDHPIQLELKIVDTVWIRALADGERVLEGTFRAGEEKPIRARGEVTMKVGNAGGVLMSLNGRDLPPIGPRGHVRSLTVTPAGMEVVEPPPAPRAEDEPPVPTTTASLRWAQLAWANAGR
jgi:cytoskeleton protein RodZ